jgi:hypothetical protein
MHLRKTVDGPRGVFRIFEFLPGVFQVLNSEGRAVDEFTLVEMGGGTGGMSVKQAVRQKRLRVGVPDLALAFVRELNAARLRN